MEDLFDADPAPYPKTNVAEINSVTTLIYIINKDRVKPDTKFLDKIPNTDGLLEIVTPEQIPIGKLEVQIKTLDSKNFSNPKYQCTKSFLAFCDKSILPVLLIAVDAAGAKAYWRYMSRDLLISVASVIKDNSVNVDIPVGNIIQKNNSSYVDEWIEIINNRRRRLIDFDAIENELKSQKAKNEELMKAMASKPGETDEEIGEIQRFLDYYNDLLNNDFKVIKDVYYSRAWKLGIAYSNYLPTSLNYSIFEIYYGHNLPQIKKLHGKGMSAHNSFDNITGHNRDNPIKTKPVDYAYELIVNDLKKVVNNYTILYLDTYLAREYIISFIDKFGFLLNVKGKEQNYSVQDIKNRFQYYLPLLLEAQYGGLDNIKPDTVIQVDIGLLDSRPTPLILKLMPEIEKSYQAGAKAKHKFIFTIKEFSSAYLLNLLLHLERERIEKIDRLYDHKTIPMKEMFFKCEMYSKAQVKKMLTMIYENLPTIYNNFVQEYFPKIGESIDFFNSFNRLVIIVKINENGIEFTDGPLSEKYYLINTTNPKEQRVDVYIDGIDSLPIERKGVSKYRVGHETLIINDNEYNLIASSHGRLRNIYNTNPMLDYVYDALKDRLESYLKPYYQKTGSIFEYKM